MNRIQNMRKEAGFDVTDRIKIFFNGSEKLIDAVLSFQNYVSSETLAEKLNNGDISKGNNKQEWKIGEYECTIQIEKVSS